MLQIGKHPAAGASRRPHPTALGADGIWSTPAGRTVCALQRLSTTRKFAESFAAYLCPGESRAKEQGCTCVLTFVILHTGPSPRKINGIIFRQGIGLAENICQALKWP